MNSLLEKLAKVYPKSLISEYSRVFGMSATEKLLSIFGGMTIKVPSHTEIQRAKVELDIYEALARTKTRPEFRAVRKTIQSKFGMTKSKVRGIYRTFAKLHKVAKKIADEDLSVGKLKRKRRKRR